MVSKSTEILSGHAHLPYQKVIIQENPNDYADLEKFRTFVSQIFPLIASTVNMATNFETFKNIFEITEIAVFIKNNKKKTQKEIGDKSADLVRFIDCFFKKFLEKKSVSVRDEKKIQRALIPEVHKKNNDNNPLLPKPIHSIIFSYLPFENFEDAKKLSSYLAKELDVDLFRDNLFLNKIFESNFSSLPQTNLQDADLIMYAKYGKELRNVNLRKGTFSPAEFGNFLTACSKIEAIEFCQFDQENFDEYLLKLVIHSPQLKELKIYNCKHVSDKAMVLLSKLTHLESFELYDDTGKSLVSDFGLINLVADRKTPFTTFKLTGCPRVSQLIILNVIGTQKDEVYSGSTMKNLCYSFCGNFNELFDAIPDCCKNLTSLELGFLNQYSRGTEQIRENFERFLKHLSELSSFKLYNCKFLQSEMLSTFIEDHPDLQTLEFMRCNGISPAFFSHLSNFSKELTSLKLDMTHKVDNYVWPIKDLVGCKKLNSISLFNFKINSGDLNELLETRPELTHLELNNCGDVNASVLYTLGKTCPKLQILEIQDPSNFDYTDASVKGLLDGCPALYLLNLETQKTKKMDSLTSDTVTLLNSSSVKHISITGIELSSKIPSIIPLT